MLVYYTVTYDARYRNLGRSAAKSREMSGISHYLESGHPEQYIAVSCRLLAAIFLLLTLPQLDISMLLSVQGDLVAVGVLSGNRNFEGRINPLTRANYLASPPLVIAYALAGTVLIDFENEPIGEFVIIIIIIVIIYCIRHMTRS